MAGALWKDHFRATRIAWSRGLIWVTGLTVRYALGRNVQRQPAVPNNQCHMVVFMGCHWPQQDEHRFLLDHFMRYHAWVPCILQLTSTPGTQIKCHFKIVLKQPQQPICSIPVTSKVANLMEQMLRATLHCHQRGMLHRDLKPENFLFTGRVHFSISLLCQFSKQWVCLWCQVLVNHRLKMFITIKMTRVWLQGVDGEDLKLIDFGFAVQEWEMLSDGTSTR